jgi:hypothetical protein
MSSLAALLKPKIARAFLPRLLLMAFKVGAERYFLSFQRVTDE